MLSLLYIFIVQMSFAQDNGEVLTRDHSQADHQATEATEDRVGNATLNLKDNQINQADLILDGERVSLNGLTDQCNQNVQVIVDLNNVIAGLEDDKQTLDGTPTAAFLQSLGERLGATEFIKDVLSPILTALINTKKGERDAKGAPCRSAHTKKGKLATAATDAESIASQFGEEIRLGDRALINLGPIQDSLNNATQALTTASAQTGIDFSVAPSTVAAGGNNSGGVQSGVAQNDAANEGTTGGQSNGFNSLGNGQTSRGIASEGPSNQSANEFFGNQPVRGDVSEDTNLRAGFGTASERPRPNEFSGMQVDFQGTPIGVRQSPIFGTLSEAYDRADLY